MQFYQQRKTGPFQDTATICLNGHVINDSLRKYPEHNAAFCDECGEKTITNCPACQKPIPGRIHYELVVSDHIIFAPKYCKVCGKPFPWTECQLAAAQQVASELEELNAQEKQQLQSSIEQLAKNGPIVEPAKIQFQHLLKKLGKNSCEMLKAVVTDIVSESVRKAIFQS